MLTGVLVYLDHEAVEVRHQALATLRSLLDGNMGAVQGLLLRSDHTDSAVADLIQKLMAGMSSREPDEELRYISAECIGRIGAVDPGKLALAPDGGNLDETEHQNFLLNVNSADFCVRLIMELVRACQSSREPFVVDNCMYSIQEVLKIYKISDKRSSFGDEVMNRLSDSAREIVHPLISSMYRHNPTAQPKISVPVYGSVLGRTYKDWLVNFTQCLIEHVYDATVKSIFFSCLPALKKDVRTAEFLLPHIVVSVVCGGEEGADLVVQEISAVLPDGEEGDAGLVEGNTDKLVAQAVFSILGHLRSWMRAKYNHTLRALGKSDNQLRTEEILKATREKHYQAVLNFTRRIPDESLANLSFNTGAYHRSAFYLDKTFTGPELSEPQLNAMQKLYACLAEPDLVVGVAAVRREEPSLEAQILYNQAVGNFQDALCCFERQEQVQ